MKQLSFIKIFVFIFFLFSSAGSVFAQIECGSITPDPALLQRQQQIEKEVQAYLAQRQSMRTQEDELVVTVVVHVIENNSYSETKVTDAIIKKQIDTLNACFNMKNAGIAPGVPSMYDVPARFKASVGNANIRFVLAKRDPYNNPTTGITRTINNNKSEFNGKTFEVMSGARGGHDPWDTRLYMNVWVCRLASPNGGNLAGMAPYPGQVSSQYDGIQIDPRAFGPNSVWSNQGKGAGKTLVHETGHWLGLKHIWGPDEAIGPCVHDGMDDTPLQGGPSYGEYHPDDYPISCGNDATGDMYMNFMDLTDDAGMFMFTRGQCQRMRNLFKPGAPRYALLSSNSLSVANVSKPLETATPSKASFAISVYPNPAIATVTVELSNDSEHNGKVTLYSATGQPVLMQTVTGSRVTLNVSALKAGVYFLKYSGGGNNSMVTVVKK